MRHKHADTIIAWANGAKIQFRAIPHAPWVDCAMRPPEWSEAHEYRIKPEPKPDLTVNKAIVCVKGSVYCTVQEPPNASFTFDGETGALKSVEILK